MRKMMLLAVLAFAAPVLAQTMTQQLQACQAISDSPGRLACYDRVSRGLPAVAPAPAPYAPAPYAPARPAYAPPPANAVSQFGAENLGDAEPRRRLNAMVADIADYKLDPHGKFVVTLANGQVWKQQQADTGITRIRSTARSVKISRAFMGSYSLTFNDMKPLYKVERVR